MSSFAQLKFDSQGLVPAIVQDAQSGQVLMLAYMNAEALQRTLESGETHFWSRSRNALWHKGETSGNVQQVLEIRSDCDGDALLVRVIPAGPACHTGEFSCFFQVDFQAQERPFSLSDLFELIRARQAHPSPGSYTAQLFAAGLPRIAQKVGEESAEVIVAALAQEGSRLVEEAADLVYHLLVLLAARDLTLAEVLAELARRHHRG